MSYTINPNAKNKWARNAENTMDLSLETDASSVYLDNGRTLEQEIGEGSMVSNVATVDSAMSKVIDGTLDGAYESCVFKGKSLVNISNKAQEIEILGRVNTHTQIEIANKDLLKRNTKYILILGYDVTFDTNSSNKTLYLDNGHGHTYIKGLTKRNIATDSGKGVFVSIITTKDEEKTSNSNIHITLFKGSDSNRVIISNLMLIEYQEGMENWDIPYFTELCDVKMPILRNVGKNLFNGELEMGGYTGSSGLPYDSDIRVRSVEKIFLPKGTYTLSSDGATKTIFTIYDLNSVFKKEFISNNSSCTITLNEDCMVHICVENEKLLNSHIQLEQGSNATPYEDYKTNILRTPEIVTLRSLPNGVRDELSVMTGEYIKRIGEVVLNGSEDWAKGNGSSNDVSSLFYIKIPNAEGGFNSFMCDIIPSIKGFTPVNGTDGIYVDGSSDINIRISNSKLVSNDVNGFKQWLSQNPITVQYELAKPITTIVEPLTIPFAYQNGHIILESGHEGQSLLPTLEYSTVVNKTGLIENVAKTIQRQEKQLTMLEKMLIQNIINLDYNNTLLALKNEMEEML